MRSIRVGPVLLAAVMALVAATIAYWAMTSGLRRAEAHSRNQDATQRAIEDHRSRRDRGVVDVRVVE